MEQFMQTLSLHQDDLTNACGFLSCPVEQACFFDIETTGLSPKVSSLYLLGAAFYRDKQWRLVQWFADDYISEKEILLKFKEFLVEFSTIFHYNGTTFDVPYLEKKYQTYQVSSPFQGKQSIDLYRQLSHKKKLFSLPNEKLTSMEQLFDFHRQDSYSGKDCMQLYTDFMQAKFAKNPQELTLKKHLLTHNRDDLIGTVLCCNLLYYKKHCPSEASYSIKEDLFILTEHLPISSPAKLCCEQDGCQICFDTHTLTVEIPLYQGILYHYFDDYKNYYYLPDEDTAIHKSVGTFVEANHRKQATASNCYIKKSGFFLPLPKNFETTRTLFKESRRSSKGYLFLNNKQMLTGEECNSYIKQCLEKL